MPTTDSDANCIFWGCLIYVNFRGVRCKCPPSSSIPTSEGVTCGLCSRQTACNIDPIPPISNNLLVYNLCDAIDKQILDKLELLCASDHMATSVREWFEYLKSKTSFLKYCREKLLCYSLIVCSQENGVQRPLASFLKCFENVTFKDIVKISSVLCRSKNHKKGVYESQNHDLSNYFCGVFNVYMRSDIDKIKSTSKMLFDNNQITRENSYIVSFLKLLTDKFDLCEAINIVSKKLVIKKCKLKHYAQLYL